MGRPVWGRGGRGVRADVGAGSTGGRGYDLYSVAIFVLARDEVSSTAVTRVLIAELAVGAGVANSHGHYVALVGRRLRVAARLVGRAKGRGAGGPGQGPAGLGSRGPGGRARGRPGKGGRGAGPRVSRAGEPG